MSITDNFAEHVSLLAASAEAGDDTALKSLAIITMLLEGWHPGDPEPDPDGGGPDGDGGEEVVDMAEYRLRLVV